MFVLKYVKHRQTGTSQAQYSTILNALVLRYHFS